MRYDIICGVGHTATIDKPMAAAYPVCPTCGKATRRLFSTVPAVIYSAAGFYTTDVTRFANMVGPERAAKFERQKAAAEQRAKAGKLTPYEKVLEGIE